MGFKSVMKKIGKVALAAAPYVAAPFTGGASLAFTGMANKALGAWNQHDANVAAAKGLAPSSFDRILGTGADYASMAGGMGAMGGLGKSFGAGGFKGGLPTTGKLGTLASVGQGVMDRFGGQGQGSYPQYGGTSYNEGGGSFDNRGGGGGTFSNLRSMSSGGGGGMNYGGSAKGLGPQMNPMGMADQNNPNLSMFIGQGRREAINDQPFRRGYNVNYLGSDDETPFKARMPKIGAVQPERGGRSKQRRQAES